MTADEKQQLEHAARRGASNPILEALFEEMEAQETLLENSVYEPNPRPIVPGSPATDDSFDSDDRDW